MKGFFEVMKKFTGEGEFRRYKIFKGFRILSGCLYCEGALFWRTEYSPDNKGVYVCLHCGRKYLSLNGHIRLWPYREYEHLIKKDESRRRVLGR